VIGQDPLLIDPENGDYRPAPGSPAQGYGCRNFPGDGIRGGAHGATAIPKASSASFSGAAARKSAREEARRDELWVSGSITDDTTWNADKILVTSDVTVENGVTLTVPPGCVVEFQGYYRLSILGTILAVGTPEARILFTTNDPEAFTPDRSLDGCWNGIRFHDTPSTNAPSRLEFSYCQWTKIPLLINASA